MDSILSSGEAADISPRQKALLLFSSKLSKYPSEATKADVERLSDNGLNTDEVLDLMFAASVFSWVNRLSHVLGDPLAQN